MSVYFLPQSSFSLCTNSVSISLYFFLHVSVSNWFSEFLLYIFNLFDYCFWRMLHWVQRIVFLVPFQIVLKLDHWFRIGFFNKFIRYSLICITKTVTQRLDLSLEKDSIFYKLGSYGLISFSDYIFLLTVLSSEYSPPHFTSYIST